jgi:hypothetical protein
LIPGIGALRKARHMAAQRGLEASLMIDDWNQTCADQEYRCAYCEGLVLIGTIDHFLPMARQGGTVVTNCLLSCSTCNHAKGESHPNHFLKEYPEKLARIRYYLANRQMGQSFFPFWTFSLPKEVQSVKQNETHITSYTLTSGIDLNIQSDGHQLALQLRQPPQSDTDLLASGHQLGTLLTPGECAALAGRLLEHLARIVEKPQA